MQICRGAEVLVKRWCRGAGAELVLVLRFRCRRAAIAVVLVLLVQILYLQRCRGGAEMKRCRDAE